jgi:hypothetical protein
MELNWKEGELGGFSGAPVLELLPNMEGRITPVPIGILVTGNMGGAHFLTINVATDAIAQYLAKKHDVAP